MRAQSNITPDLATCVDAADAGRLLDIIVELDDDAQKAPDIAAAKAAFGKVADPVADAIMHLGGKVVEGAWINRTLLVRLPAASVPAVANLDHVAAVDVPHAIEPD